MAFEILVQNRQGLTQNYATIDTTVSLETKRTSSPAKLKFNIIKKLDTNFHEGNICRFSVDGKHLFTGYVFTKVKNRYGEIDVTCYDQMRYLKAKDSFSFIGKSLPEIIQEIAGNFQLNVGSLANTGYTIPYLIKENKECLDIINTALQKTVIETGKIYTFFDDGGALTLKADTDMMVAEVVGSKSLVTDYDYKTDIDKQTYNQIKLVRPNEETGKADTYIYLDSSTISLWGTLQYYEQVDEEMNPAQIEEYGRQTLAYYNRVYRELKLKNVLGIVGLRAGHMIMANIPDLGDISLSKFILLDKVTHNFTDSAHTMDLEARIII